MTAAPAEGWNHDPRPEDATTFAGRLRLAIGVRSLKDIAARSGVRRYAIRMLLRGRKRGAYIDTIIALAKACGVAPAWLAFGDHELVPPVRP